MQRKQQLYMHTKTPMHTKKNENKNKTDLFTTNVAYKFEYKNTEVFLCMWRNGIFHAALKKKLTHVILEYIILENNLVLSKFNWNKED